VSWPLACLLHEALKALGQIRPQELNSEAVPQAWKELASLLVELPPAELRVSLVFLVVSLVFQRSVVSVALP